MHRRKTAWIIMVVLAGSAGIIGLAFATAASGRGIGARSGIGTCLTISQIPANEEMDKQVPNSLPVPNPLNLRQGLPSAARGQNAPAAEASDAKIDRILSNLTPSLHLKGRPAVMSTLAARMAALKIPAVSIAVTRDSRIEWTRAYGFRDVEEKLPATPETLFQAASISKPVAAAAALHFVDRGVLGLDEDVNAKLSSWKVPENSFTAKQKVTLRRILSHSAGLTVHGFAGYPAGEPLPALRQILDGEPPANSAPIRVNLLPGFRWRYSGGGFTVLQQLLVDVIGRPFPDIMKEIVLDPAGMTESAYAQPLPDRLLSRAAAGYTSDGTPVGGRRHVYPELAAAGLWTTPADLCKFALEIAAARDGRSDKVLSQKTAQAMLTIEKAPSGLGFMLDGMGADVRFSHSGGNAGFLCDLVFFPERGAGMAVMTNSENGSALIAEIERAIAAEYGLPAFRPVIEKEIVPMDAAALERFVGNYEIDFEGQKTPVTIAVKDDHLAATAADSLREIYPESEMSFFAMDLSLSLLFLKDAGGRITGFIVDGTYPAKRTDK